MVVVVVIRIVFFMDGMLSVVLRTSFEGGLRDLARIIIFN